MDLIMPIMDGFEASRDIKQNLSCSNKKTIIVGLSSYMNSKTKQKCLDHDIDYVSVTPLCIAWLKSTVIAPMYNQ